MEDYKSDIIQTRTGNLGSSDAKLLMQVAQLGYVPKSFYKRLAVVKGFIENPDITNIAMRYGDYVENMVFDILKSQDGRWQSNPCLVSKIYSRENCGIIDHVDFLLQDDEKKTVTLVECKATKYSFEHTRNIYEAQLMHHFALGSELAKELGKYSAKVLLAHYCTEGIELTDDSAFEFDPSRLTVKPCRFGKSKSVYDIGKAADIVSEFLKTFEGYQAGDEINSQYLPDNVKEEFNTITGLLANIKQYEAKVDEFKKRLCGFMQENNIKSINNEAWGITLVPASEAVQFDGKKFMSEYAIKHPRLAAKLKNQYEKRTKKSAYVKITLKENNNE